MPSKPISLIPLTSTELQELMSSKSRVFLPDYVARALCNRTTLVDLAEIPEIAPLINQLIEKVQKWMKKESISLPKDLDSPLPKLNQRAKTRLKLLAALLPYRAYALYFMENDAEKAEEVIIQGIVLARLSNDTRQEAFLWCALGIIYSYLKKDDRQDEIYATALSVAESPGDDPAMELLVAGEYTAALVTHNRLDKAMEIIEAKLERGKEKLSREEQNDFLPLPLMNKGRILSIRDQKADAILVLQEGLEYAQKQKGGGHILPILSHLGMQYRALGDQESNITLHHEMIRITGDQKNTLARLWAYTRIAESYILLGDYENAEESLEFALNQAHSSQHLDYIYAKWAEVRFHQERYDEALEYCHHILELFPDGRVSPVLISTYSLIARILAAQGKPAEAEQAYRQSLAISQQTGAASSSTPMLIGLVELLIEQDKKKEAEDIINKLINDLEGTESEQSFLAIAYRLKGRLAEKSDNFKEALELARRSHSTSIANLEAKAEEKLQKARMRAEVDLIKAETEFERKQRKQAEKNLAEALLAFEGKRNALESAEEQLRKTLSLLNQEKAREVVNILRHVLESIETAESTPEYSLHYLQTVDQEFFIRLRERWPDLTRKQEHYCGLIRAGLSSREIAGVMNLGIEGIRAQRKRLRKRLGLKTKEKLESVIMDV